MKTPILFALALIWSTGALAQQTTSETEPQEKTEKSSAVPTTIDFQGRLHDSGGNPVNATLLITFTLYDMLAGGSILWSEDFMVEIMDGLFQVKLGQINPITPDLFAEPDRWLGIRIGGEAELSPRTKISSAGYALQAPENDPTWLGTPEQSSAIGRMGSVGIGTTSPTHKLDVDGQIRIRGGSPGSGKVLVSDENGVASWATQSFSLPLSGTTSEGTYGISVGHTATSGETYGGRFTSASTTSVGVYGLASALTGETRGGVFESASYTGGVGVIGSSHNMGVMGSASSPYHGYGGYFESHGYNGGAGVRGDNWSTTGEAYGGIFYSSSTSGVGLRSDAFAESGETYGGIFSSQSPDGTGIYAAAMAGSGNAFGAHFISYSSSGIGVYGLATAHSGNTFGGYFESQSNTGTGVRGLATATSGYNAGGSFSTASPYGDGVYGVATASSGDAWGGNFTTYSSGGRAVNGLATATSGETFGGFFESRSNIGAGVRGLATATNGNTFGGFFESQSNSGAGVRGFATATNGETSGGHFESQSNSGTGVRGLATATSGSTFGGFFITASPDGDGVFGVATALSGNACGGKFTSESPGGVGVYGFARSLTGENYGVYGTSYSNSGYGVFGRTTYPNGITYGVFGWSDSNQGRAVWGFASSTTGITYGVVGRNASTEGRALFGDATATSGTNYGVYGKTSSSAGYAGYFEGRVHVTGNLSKGGGSFEIDHPLDPENKILRHSFVESPDMMNVYNGNIITDENGKAVVYLPDYFEILNRDFRYQLTVIGEFAQAIISEEISNNHFSIRTDKPNVKVSWQVTGVRHDPWAEQNRIIVEEFKNTQIQGYYLHPKPYGQPETRSVEWAENPEMLQTREEEEIRQHTDQQPLMEKMKLPDIIHQENKFQKEQMIKERLKNENEILRRNRDEKIIPIMQHPLNREGQR